MILIMTVAGGFFMDRNKMSKKGYKTLISGTLAGLLLGVTYAFSPKIMGILILIAIVYWVVVFIRWALK